MLHDRQDRIIAVCLFERSGEYLVILKHEFVFIIFVSVQQGDSPHPAVPSVLFGTFCLIDAVIIYFFLPETTCDSMPDTISDIDDDVSDNGTSRSDISA